MKKFIILLSLVCMLFVGCAPAANPSPSSTVEQTQSPITEPTPEASPDITSEKDAADSQDNGTIEVDKNLLTVEVTYPASLIGEDKESVLNSKEEGIKKVTENDDGSITVTMTKAKYNEMMDAAAKQTKEFLDSIVSDGDYQSVKKVTYNNNFTEIELEVDKEAYENSFDGFVNLSIGITAGFYNLFAVGKDFKIVIKTKDAATGEVFSEYIFPDSLEQATN